MQGSFGPIDLDACVACGMSPDEETMTAVCTQDDTGLPWCAEHQHRGDFLNWGKAHGFRALHAGEYAVGEGQELWQIVATLGNEHMIWTLRSYQEMLSADDTRGLEVA